MSEYSKFKDKSLFIIIKGKVLPLKDHQLKSVEDLRKGLELIKKAGENGIKLKEDKLTYTDNDKNVYTIIAADKVKTKVSSDESSSPTKKKGKVKSSSSEETTSKKKASTRKKGKAKSSSSEEITSKKKGKTPIIKKVESISSDEEEEKKETMIQFSTKTSKDRAKLFDILYNIYKEKYRPPEWTRDVYINRFEKYAPVAMVFSTSKDTTLIKRLVTEREPVNITMKRGYDLEAMQKEFGYSIGFYQRYYEEHKKLAPNIGIYTLSSVKTKEGFMDVHFYHAIGYALDSELQPDYKVYHNHEELLSDKYLEVFAGVFTCAKKLKLSTVYMSIVGGGAFSSLYPGGSDRFQRKVWVPAFREAVAKYGKGLTIRLIGGDSDKAIAILSKEYSSKGYFPAFLYDDFDANNTLVVNSYDPFSFPSNGNSADPSLDGRIGRVSAIWCFGNGITNPYLLKNIHDVNMY